MVQGTGVWVSVSSKFVKENLIEMDGKRVLDNVKLLPVYQYNYINTHDKAIFRGPVAEEWNNLFPGVDPKGIDSMSLSGVCLSAIKELIRQNESLTKRIEKLECI
jgi:hypothetical protein